MSLREYRRLVRAITRIERTYVLLQELREASPWAEDPSVQEQIRRLRGTADQLFRIGANAARRRGELDVFNQLYLREGGSEID